VQVAHAIGSLENPMSDQALESKFMNLSEPILGKQQTQELIKACWNLGKASDLKSLLKLSTPN